MAAPQVVLKLGARRVRTDEPLQGTVVVTAEEDFTAEQLVVELTWSVAGQASEQGQPIRWVWVDDEWVADEVPDHERRAARSISPRDRAHPYRDGRGEDEADEAGELRQGRAPTGERALQWERGTHRYPLAISAPSGPVSYEGKLFEVGWHVEARIHGADDEVVASKRQEFTLEPGDLSEPFLGPEHEPPPERVGAGWRRPLALVLMTAVPLAALVGAFALTPHGATGFWALAGIVCGLSAVPLFIRLWHWRERTPSGVFRDGKVEPALLHPGAEATVTLRLRGPLSQDEHATAVQLRGEERIRSLAQLERCVMGPWDLEPQVQSRKRKRDGYDGKVVRCSLPDDLPASFGAGAAAVSWSLQVRLAVQTETSTLVLPIAVAPRAQTGRQQFVPPPVDATEQPPGFLYRWLTGPIALIAGWLFAWTGLQCWSRDSGGWPITAALLATVLALALAVKRRFFSATAVALVIGGALTAKTYARPLLTSSGSLLSRDAESSYYWLLPGLLLSMVGLGLLLLALATWLTPGAARPKATKGPIWTLVWVALFVAGLGGGMGWGLAQSPCSSAQLSKYRTSRAELSQRLARLAGQLDAAGELPATAVDLSPHPHVRDCRGTPANTAVMTYEQLRDPMAEGVVDVHDDAGGWVAASRWTEPADPKWNRRNRCSMGGVLEHRTRALAYRYLALVRLPAPPDDTAGSSGFNAAVPPWQLEVVLVDMSRSEPLLRTTGPLPEGKRNSDWLDGVRGVVRSALAEATGGTVGCAPRSEAEEEDTKLPQQLTGLGQLPQPGEPVVLRNRRKGPAWLGTAGAGLVKLDQGGFRSLLEQPRHVLAIAPGWGGDLWLLSHGSVHRYTPGDASKVEEIELPEGGYDDRIAVGPKADLWTAGLGGVARHDGERWTTYPNKSIGSLAGGSPAALFVDSDERTWFVQHPAIHWFHAGTWQSVATHTAGPYLLTKSAALSLDHAVLLNTDQGVVRADGTSWHLIMSDGHPPGDYLDVGGGLVHRSSGCRVQTFVPPVESPRVFQCGEHFDGTTIEAMVADGQGRTWIATDVSLVVIDGAGQVREWPPGTVEAFRARPRSIYVQDEGPVLPVVRRARTGAIKGRVELDGKPSGLVPLTLCTRANSGDSSKPACREQSFVLKTETDSGNGAFLFENVPVFEWDIVWERDGRWHSRHVCCDMKAGQTLDVGTIRY